jgi:hypothetical protein
MPPLGGTLRQFADHRQPRHAGAAAAGLVGASTDSGKHRFAGMGRPDGPPRLGGEIIKRQEHCALLRQARGRLRRLGLLGGEEHSKGHRRPRAVGGQPDRLAALCGLRREGWRPFVEPMGRLMAPTPWPTGLAGPVAPRLPKSQRPLPNRPGWPVLSPVTLEGQPPCLPGWLALAVAVPPSDQCLVATGVSAQNAQETMPPFLQAGLKGDTVHPAIAIPLALEAATWPLRPCLGPALLQSAARRRGEPRRRGPSEGLERRRAIPR